MEKLRPRLNSEEVKVLLEALNRYIEQLEKEQEHTPAPLFCPFESWRPLQKARYIKTKLMRNSKGMIGRTNKNYYYLHGMVDSPF